jgi:hypothetical protein
MKTLQATLGHYMEMFLEAKDALCAFDPDELRETATAAALAQAKLAEIRSHIDSHRLPGVYDLDARLNTFEIACSSLADTLDPPKDEDETETAVTASEVAA